VRLTLLQDYWRESKWFHDISTVNNPLRESRYIVESVGKDIAYTWIYPRRRASLWKI
jgi:hypothetical protein